MSKQDGGPAFPTFKPVEGIGDNVPGMTLRDYFAGQAIAELLASIVKPTLASNLALEAWQMADAMLAARSVPPEGEEVSR